MCHLHRATGLCGSLLGDSASFSLCFSLRLAADMLHFVADYVKAAIEQGLHARKEEGWVVSRRYIA